MLRRRLLNSFIEDGGGNDSYCKALFHFENNITDSSSNNLTCTGDGLRYSTSIKKFGTYGAYLSDTSRAGVTLPSGFSNTYLTGDFTIDYWYRPPYSITEGAFDDHFFLGMKTNDTYSFVSCYIGKYNGVNYIEVGCYSYDGSITAFVYHVFESLPQDFIHVAVVRKNGIIYLYINGVSVGTPAAFNYTIDASQSKSLVNCYNGGNMDEFRISNIARWTENFTPPTQAY